MSLSTNGDGVDLCLFGECSRQCTAPLRQFLSRYAMHKCGLCRRAMSVCMSVLSVRLSLTFVYSVEISEHMFKLFHRLVDPSF